MLLNLLTPVSSAASGPKRPPGLVRVSLPKMTVGVVWSPSFAVCTTALACLSTELSTHHIRRPPKPRRTRSRMQWVHPGLWRTSAGPHPRSPP